MSNTPFVPEKLPTGRIGWEELVGDAIEANRAIAKYDGLLEGIPNPQILLSPLMTQEAVLSSKIEGTVTTVEEVLEFEADRSALAERRDDIMEVLNYRRAMSFAEQELGNRPLCLNLIKSVHSMLLEGVRGRLRARGEFRTTQVWIGKPGSAVERASYVPPEPARVPELMANLEAYFHHDEKDALVQCAIVHAQFEMIHPFLDGNGRVGRILIPLFLFSKRVISKPMFYISAYLESERDSYYSRLRAVSEDGDWIGWIKYFLGAVREQSRRNSFQAKEIMNLYEEMKQTVQRVTRSRFAIQILDFLFDRPAFTSTVFASSTGIPRPSAARVLKKLKDGGVLQILRPGKGRRSGIYVFRRLLDIVGR